MRESARDSQQREPEQSALAQQVASQFDLLRAQLAGLTLAIATTATTRVTTNLADLSSTVASGAAPADQSKTSGGSPSAYGSKYAGSRKHHGRPGRALNGKGDGRPPDSSDSDCEKERERKRREDIDAARQGKVLITSKHYERLAEQRRGSPKCSVKPFRREGDQQLITGSCRWKRIFSRPRAPMRLWSARRFSVSTQSLLTR